MHTQRNIRPSPIAGRWYPANPEELASSVDEYIANARLPEIEGEVLAIVTPHAGHVYSGPVAGYAFAAVRGLHPEIVAVVSPMHYPFSDPLLTSAHTAYATPLGEIPLDQEVLADLDNRLKQAGRQPLSRVSRDPEHSLEIELPFLQRALAAEFRLVPIMLRELSPQVLQTLGSSLAQSLQGRSALLVASTDLSHFYTQSTAARLDQEILRRLAAFDPLAVLSAEEEGVGFACGRSAVAAVLWAAREVGANHVQILHYATSGDVSGDYQQVVGYAAAVITRQ